MRRSSLDERAQSAPIGVILVLAIVILGTATVVLLGSAAMTRTQEASQLEQATNEMTLFDSRVSTVALGESSRQVITLEANGDYYVRPDAGWLSITHTNYDDEGNDEEVYNATLGAFVHRSGDTTIAYQGGGVWRLGPSGAARMVSPPELHYRASTLTLPLVQVTGTGSAAGGATVAISDTGAPRKIYPNSSQTYAPTAAVSNLEYRNPAENGSVSITVRSVYYEGWADYFRNRAEGDVTVYHNNQTTRLDLFTLGDRGAFTMPGDVDSGSGDSITVRGVEGGHTLTEFDIMLTDDESDSANLNNLQWSMFAEEGNRQLEMHLKKGSGDEANLYVYYSDDGGSTYHGWESTSTIPYVEQDVDGDGDLETSISVDFLGSLEMQPTSLSKSNLQHFNPQGTAVDPTWSQHGGTTVVKNGVDTTETATFQMNTDTTIVNNVTNHYFALMGTEFRLRVDDQNSDSINEGGSSGTIDYPGNDRFITYLHITENEVEVDVN